MPSATTKLVLGGVLTVLGGGVVLYGAGLALVPLIRMYQGAMEHPLDEPPGGEKHVSEQMLHGVKVGAIGVLPLIGGSVLLKAGMFQMLRRRRD